MSKIKVLVVDDSAFMRKVLAELLESGKEIEVIATARDGKDALDKIRQYKPDVVTLDVDMPVMDGISALKEIMATCPLPVLMISAHTQKNSEIAIKSLDYGAIDFVAKTDGSISFKMEQVKDELIDKVKAASKANISYILHKLKTIPEKSAVIPPKPLFAPQKIVVIGASTGGPPALEEVLTQLPKDIPAPILVVQHMPANFTKLLAERLNSLSEIEIREAKDGDFLQEGLALVAPGGYHMELKRINGPEGQLELVRLNENPPEEGVRPCINVTMRSVAPLYGKKTVGVILTGMGKDGTDGLKAIKNAGGTSIVQDRKSSLIYGMPKAAADAGVADHIVPLGSVAKKIIECL